jgi:ribosomal protein L32
MSEHRWTDRWVALWYRLTYCTRHGHYKVHEGVCLNCGTRVRGSDE